MGAIGDALAAAVSAAAPAFGPAWLLRPRLDEPGEIYTFYSYKGGTGRSMGLVNCAGLIAQHLPLAARSLLLVDFDLEAPGLHRYLEPCVDRAVLAAAPGVLDLFEALAREVDAQLASRGLPALDDERVAALVERFDLAPYRVPVRLPGDTDASAPARLHLIAAGRFDEQYDERLARFDWPRLHARAPALFRAVAARLAGEHSFVFVDSRTGLSDTSGISTMLLPDVLVVVFTPNSQSLTGIEHLVRRAVAYREQASDMRPLRVYPLASRVDNQVEHFRRVWRLGDTNHALFGHVQGYQPLFEQLFEQTLAADIAPLGTRLADYFDQVQVPHTADYAFGERLCFGRQASSDSLSIRGAYELFLPWLVTGAQPWERPEVALVDLRAQLWLREAGVAEPPASEDGWPAWFDRVARAAATSEFAGLLLSALNLERCFDVALAQLLASAHVGDFAKARTVLSLGGAAYADTAAPTLARGAPAALLRLLRGGAPPKETQVDASAWLEALDALMTRWQSLKSDRREWLEALEPLAGEWSMPELRWRAATELHGETSEPALEAQLALALARQRAGDIAGALALAEPLARRLPPGSELAEALSEVLSPRSTAESVRALPPFEVCESTAFICAAHADNEISFDWVRHFSGELERGLAARLRGIRVPRLSNFGIGGPTTGTLSEALKGQIKKSFAFLLFVGEDLVASEWALRELEVFFELYGEAARERLYVIAMSKPAMQALTALPRWTRLGLCDQLWLPFWDESIPHLPIPIHAKKSRDVVVSNEFWERFVRLRDALADSIRRSHEEGVRAAAPAVAEARAAASGASNVLAVGSSETSSAAAGAPLINATIFIESNRDERDEWEALGELLRERWPAQGGQAASLRLRVRGLPLDLMQDMNLLADADGVVLLWGRKPAQALVSQIDKLERQLPGADPCPGLVAHLSPPQPEADDALPAWGWRVVRFRLPAAERALVHEADAVDLDRFLARVAQHARARPAPSPG